MISVIIPAYNEENVIARCLNNILRGINHSDLEIFVVCNGCIDRTMEIAEQYGPPVKAVSILQSSKIAALNTGDALATSFPRFYIDADVEISGYALQKVAKQLESPEVLAAAPALQVNLSHSSWAVKSFYAVWTSLPYFSRGDMIGSGVYALSEEGRKRFDTFPDIIADDAFVRLLFTREERETVHDCNFAIHAPTNLNNLIKIKTRSRFGRTILHKQFPSLQQDQDTTSFSAFRLLAKKPFLLPAMAVYLYVQVQTKRHTRRKLATADFSTWERDESSRPPVSWDTGKRP
ncbi:MAG TPA: glycosyl transferase [Clostridiales bacterium]|jgi:glycosyltransferase involved in cell wall biosynthesis|nr:glycosyl transferase [Clostridiales bacterium]